MLGWCEPDCHLEKDSRILPWFTVPVNTFSVAIISLFSSWVAEGLKNKNKKQKKKNKNEKTKRTDNFNFVNFFFLGDGYWQFLNSFLFLFFLLLWEEKVVFSVFFLFRRKSLENKKWDFVASLFFREEVLEAGMRRPCHREKEVILCF